MANRPTLVVVSGRPGTGKTALAHADSRPVDAAARTEGHGAFAAISRYGPSLTIDTADGYDPGIEDILAFIESMGPQSE